MPDDTKPKKDPGVFSNSTQDDSGSANPQSVPSSASSQDFPSTIPAQPTTPSADNLSDDSQQTSGGNDNTTNTMADNKESNPGDVITSPHAPKKYGGKKIIATIFGVLLLIAGVTAGVFLVQRQQEIAERAASGKECTHSPNCILLDNPGNSGNFTAPRNIIRIYITAKDYHEYLPGDTDDSCYKVSIHDRNLSWERIGSGPDCKDISNVQVWLGEEISVTPTPTGPAPPSCPSDTDLLFSRSGSLNTGDSVGADGKVGSMQGSWKVGSRDGILMAEDGRTINVDFPSLTLLDTVLIFDNDPKSGEQPWSINGTSLPVTGGGKWAPPFKLNKTVTQMSFDNGGDSPHFNICIKKQTVTNTPTPTTTTTLTPSPTPTTPPSITAECSEVKAYTTSWGQLTQEQLNNLEAGDMVRFTVSGTTTGGTFDKARFTINGTQRDPVTTKKPGTEEYYDQYEIPDDTYDFSVDAQIHHSSLGWF